MSSNAYSAELHPDARLRVLVLMSGFVLGVAGLVLILGLVLPTPIIGLGVALWFYCTLREVAVLAREYRGSRGLRLYPDRSLMRQDEDGRWRPVRLLPGSIVLPRLAWIRFETGRGIHAAEPFCGDPQRSDDWRRLQVIWRHIGAAR